MRRVFIDNLKGTEVLAKPIYTEDDKILLSRGVAVKLSYIVKLKEMGIDISDKKPKHLSIFADKKFDTVILTCDCGDKCPKIPKNRQFIRKMFADPSEFSGSKDEILKGFRGVLEEISLWTDETFSKKNR